MKIRFLLLLVCGLGGMPLMADEIDDHVLSEMQARHIPGAALLVMQNGETIKAQGYGLASIELGAKITTGSVFDVASITKPITATAVLLLVDEGRLKLDDPVTLYLPDAPMAWSHITVRNLLSHTGGFAGLQSSFYGNVGKLPDGGLWAEYSTAALYNPIRERAPEFPPGERWQYSDEGYFLLGMIIEKVSGKRYPEFLAERIFRPLGMSHSSVIDQWTIVPNRVAGYMLRDGKLAPNRRLWQIELQSYGGVLSTTGDLALWNSALQEGKLLKPETLRQMETAFRLNDGSYTNYGLGWSVSEYHGQHAVDHSGSTGTYIASIPAAHFTVILLTNLDAMSGSNPGAIATWIAEHVLARMP